MKGAHAAAGIGLADEDLQNVGDTNFERTVICSILKSISEELNLASKDIVEMVEAVEKMEDDEKLGSIIDAKLVTKATMSDLEWEKGPVDVHSGEWMSIALSKVLQNTEKTCFKSLNALLKIILFKLVLYDLCYPQPTRMFDEKTDTGSARKGPVPQSDKGSIRKAPVSHSDEGSALMPEGSVDERKWGSKLDVGKYKIKSVVEMRGGWEMRTWYCPYEDCGQWFGSSHKCRAHLNKHLNHIYECPKCRYQTYSLDGYNHYVCFVGPKTQGNRKMHLKCTKPSTASGGEASQQVSVPVKKEKMEDDDPEIIVLNE